MLSNKSLCIECSNKKICKFYDDVINNTDIEFSIDKCEHSTSNKQIINNINQTTIDNNICYYKDYNNVKNDTNVNLNNTSNILAMPIEMDKEKCQLCGKEVYISNIQKCSDCGAEICSECGYTNVDVNSNNTIITCDKCFTGIIPGEDPISAWDLTQYTINEKIDAEEEDSDVRKKQSRVKRSNPKSKKS